MELKTTLHLDSIQGSYELEGFLYVLRTDDTLTISIDAEDDLIRSLKFHLDVIDQTRLKTMIENTDMISMKITGELILPRTYLYAFVVQRTSRSTLELHLSVNLGNICYHISISLNSTETLLFQEALA